MELETNNKKPVNKKFGKAELAVVLSVAGVIIALLIVCIVVLVMQMRI